MEQRRKHWMHVTQHNYKNNSCSHSGSYHSRNYNNIYSPDEVEPLASNPNLTTVGTSTSHTHTSYEGAYTRENPINYSKSSQYIYQSPQDFDNNPANMKACTKTCRIIIPAKRKPGPFDDLKKSDFFNCFGNFLTAVLVVLFALSIIHYMLSSDEVHPQEELKENVTNITRPSVNHDDDEEDVTAGNKLESYKIDKHREEIQAFENRSLENAREEEKAHHQRHHLEIHRDKKIHHHLLGQKAPSKSKHRVVERYITKHHHSTIPTHHITTATSHHTKVSHTTQDHPTTEQHPTTEPHHTTEHHHTTVPHHTTEQHKRTEHHHTTVPQKRTEHHHKTEHHHTIVPHKRTEHHHTIVPHKRTEHHHHTIVAPTTTKNTQHTYIHNAPQRTQSWQGSTFGFGSDHKPTSWFKHLLNP